MEAVPPGYPSGRPSNKRMKLAARVHTLFCVRLGRCSLCAFRYTAAATMTKALWFSGARHVLLANYWPSDSGRTTFGAVGSHGVRGCRLLASGPARPPLSNTRLKLSAHGLGRIPFVPQHTTCSSVNSVAPVGLRAAA